MKNTTILFISKLFEKGTLFLFFIFFGRYFGKEAFGEYSYLFSIASFLFAFMDVGGEFYQIKLFADKKSNKVILNIIFIKTALFLILLSAVLVWGNFYLTLLVISFYIESVISVVRSSFYFDKKFALAATYNIFEKTLFILLFVFSSISVNNLLFMYSSLATSKLLQILLIYVNKYKKIDKRELGLDVSFIKEYLLNAWSYILHSLLVIFFGQFSIIILKKLNVSYSEIAVYSVSIKILMAIVTLFPDILFRQYYPVIARLIIENKEGLRDYL
ncbi:MAG: oligosaccharide flippase family protein, partial [Chlorobi bacterium]|nr:oligosaccharide flippase family protein [Chlorobiota bacterium]